MSWDEHFPNYKVPRAIQKMVDIGMIIDSTLSHDTSPNFDAVLSDGEILTIWVDHPTESLRQGQLRRYELRIAEPMQNSRLLLETDNLERLLEAFREVMKERGGPRMGSTGMWRMPMYEYMGYY